ncbi:PR domain containing 2, with ZNF domain S homeolog [Xenopus laevis]|uniref:LOC494709 protein n=1 Tax=Xenopus laevis TaxID=8355 RepID=Q498K4_XENLA|nr:PR domain containing 2, with ZNF domain S homeolog [Xenopus laevis]AAI00184.1 LOC494709 protein [Xenopus laevis]
MNEDLIRSSEALETLTEVPEHVLRGLPEELRLAPSAVDNRRLGVWARKQVQRGKKFGPFVGEKKKRSQVKNNVFMWEVYYPNLGWMCVDATDPQKGNWLRYVNWARSAKEQNLCSLEINRAIYYKTLKPIEPGEELLVWYNGEDNPDIAAAIEEERAASHRSKRSSPKSRRGRKRTFNVKKKINLENQGEKSADDLISAKMKDSPDIPSQEDIKPLGSPILSLEQTAVIQEMVNQNVLPEHVSVSTQEVNITEEESAVTEQTDIDDLHKDSSESVTQEEESGDMLEEIRSTSDETPEGSPKKKLTAKISKPKVDINGELTESFLYPCQHCERKFTTKQGLERHMHIHVSYVNHAFKCRYCGKAFGTQINRRRHERRHEAGLKRKTLIVSASSEFGQSQKHIIDSLKTEVNNSTRIYCKTNESERDMSQSFLSDENCESREMHPCKYCKKIFGTHTNMRRHQRRVHERHLIPKGVRRKGSLLEDPQLESEQMPPAENIYVANTEIEEDGEADDVYIMDISNNISENLTYYIDGRIQSNSTSSSCDVIEVETNTTDVLGLNCLITPIKVEVSQNIKQLQSVSVPDNPLNDSTCCGNNEPKKRRTISPPLLTKIKTEVELEPITPTCSISIPLSVSVSDNLSFPKEKHVYLSSKLKQLLQMQDSNTSQVSPSLLSEVSKSGAALSTVSNRFKRRTTSPPSSPQHSPGSKEFVKQIDGKTTWTEVLGPKVPKCESLDSSPAWSLSGKEERDNTSPSCSEEFKLSKDWLSNSPFGNSSFQQPLDLSSGVKQKSENCSQSQVPWESVLDLSLNRKADSDSDSKELKGINLCIGIKKKKPTACMLKKVLLNEYDGIEITGEYIQQSENILHHCKSEDQRLVLDFGTGSNEEISLPPDNSVPPPVENTHVAVSQSPPILTSSEVHLLNPNPPASLTEVRSPPSLLTTTLPSLPDSLCSVPATPSCPSSISASTQSPLPVLSPTASPSPPPSPADDPSVSASPGPPTLSSSSPTSSSSSSSSSCSSPPPLSVVSYVVSPSVNSETSAVTFIKQEKTEEDVIEGNENEKDPLSESFNKSFICNVCESPFVSIKDLARHIFVHAEDWPFKCEFCVQLFKDVPNLSEHRLLLHGVGKIFVCSLCKKEFAFLCNLQQHQQDLHADKEYSHQELESGTLRPQNYTDPSKMNAVHERMHSDPMTPNPDDDRDLNDSSEELYTTIKIMASGEKTKDRDIRMGLNQHYPSFKPPPFQYHNKNPMGIGATATNFTTHNIPQTFTTAIRCTKCGKGVDNMPELHKHILVCASASDKKRYTPKKNPIPLRQTGQSKNGVVILETSDKTAFCNMGQPKKLNFTIEIGKLSSNKLRQSAFKKKNQLVHKAILQKNKTAKQKTGVKANMATDPESHVCPYCNRKFTYIRSLNKHASFSCPKKPASPPSKKHVSKSSKKARSTFSSSTKKHKVSSIRRTADAEIKMQSTETNLGKTRARSLGPTPVQLPSMPNKPKQSLKYAPQVNSKKQNVIRNSSPMRTAKHLAPYEGKKAKKPVLNNFTSSFGTAPKKLHVRVQKSKLQNKSMAKKKKTDKFYVKSRKRISGPITRSSQLTADPVNKRDDVLGKPDSRSFP